jgi:predicted nuclease with TOPRIM domain
MTKWYQKILRNVRKRVKRARISQQIMKDEQKRLAAIISEYQRGTKRATQISELTHATEAESVELQSKVEVLEGELRELRDRLRASEALAQQLAEKFQKSEVRVWELTRQQNAMREGLQRERCSKKRKVDETKYRAVYLKKKGILTERTRTLCRKLAGCGVPADKVNAAIHAVCTAFQINVADKISPRTVLRVVIEGGIASHLQIVDEMIRAGGKHVR